MLESTQFEGLRQSIAAKCQEQTAKLEASLKTFQELPQRIKSLEKDWQEVIRLRTRERELVNLINEDRQKPSRLGYFEAASRKAGQ